MTSHTSFYLPLDPSKPVRGRKPNKKIDLTSRCGGSPSVAIDTQYNILSGEPALHNSLPVDTNSSNSMSMRHDMPTAEMLSPKQAAAALSVHVNTVRYWVRIGLLKKVPIGTVRYRITRKEIERFQREREK